MKKLLLLTKTLLAAALLCVGQNAWATDVPYSIGYEGCGYRAEYSDPYTVKNGETLHITFTNNNYGTATVWNNYMLEATSAVDKHDGVYFDLRGDNYAFDQGTFVQNYNGNCTSDLNGATVDNYITYAGGVITVNQIFTKAEVTTYNRVYTYTVAGSPASVIIYVTEEAAQVTITNVETSKWTTVWNADFSSAPSGMTYSVTSGSCDITNGYISYHQGGGSGDRAINTAFTDAKFNVDSDWILEFDWNCSSANTNASNVVFATNSGTAFSMEWASYASAVVVKDGGGTSICTTLPLLGYNKGTCTSWSHITINGVKDEGVYLTITNGSVVYVNKQLVTSTFGYPATFNGSLGKAVSHMYVDNVFFKTPAVAGFVATPTSEITGAVGTSRKFTLSCLTDGATIYYATSDLEKGAAGWNTYSGEVTTDAATIYAYAEDDDDNTSDKMNFATGAGTAITLNAPTITLSGVAETAGLYYPKVTIVNDQSSLALVPASTTLTYKFNDSPISASSPYTFTATGELTVTVSADGYTSASSNYEVANSFAKTKTIDLAAIAEGDLSAVWTKKSDATQLPADNWKTRYSSDEFPLYIYDYTNASASNTDVINGLVVNISSESADPGVTPTLYVGAGMILPTKKVNASDLSESSTWNTNIGISVDGGTADQIAVYTYPTNYGLSTATSTIVANATYNLYRYSDMLTKVEVYSPAVSATIGATGWTTFASPYALDLSSMTASTGEVTAYYASETSDVSVTVLPTSSSAVQAGEGILLKGTAGATITIPVVASGSAIDGNLMVGCPTGATITNETANYGKCYVLGIESEQAVFQNVKDYIDGDHTVNIPAGKAYLNAYASNGARSISIVFADDVTGVANVEAASEAKAKEGKFIENGKLVIVKNGQKFNAAGAKLY